MFTQNTGLTLLKLRAMHIYIQRLVRHELRQRKFTTSLLCQLQDIDNSCPGTVYRFSNRCVVESIFSLHQYFISSCVSLSSGCSSPFLSWLCTSPLFSDWFRKSMTIGRLSPSPWSSSVSSLSVDRDFRVQGFLEAHPTVHQHLHYA